MISGCGTIGGCCIMRYNITCILPYYSHLVYYCMNLGEYGIHVKYNDVHVPDSPTFVYIAPESGDARMVTVEGIRDRGQPVSYRKVDVWVVCCSVFILYIVLFLILFISAWLIK